MPQRLIAAAPRVIEVEEFQLPPVSPSKVRIRTEFASGKHGTAQAMFDQRNYKGQRFDMDMRMFRPHVAKPNGGAGAPDVFGTTGVGIVEEVGAQVTRFKAGDRVVGLLKIATENVVDESQIWLLGEADPLESLCIEPAYVSIHAVREANVRFGDTVAVFGLGAIGLIAVQMAQRAGASKVIAVDPLEIRRNWALEHGADVVLNPLKEDAPLRIHELTGGAGVDIAIEAAGSYAALESALKSTRMRGTISAAGFYQGEAEGVWLGREFHHNRLQIIVPHGCGWGHEPRDFPRWDEWRTYDTMVGMLQSGKLDLSGLIHPLVALDEAPDVWRRIEEEPGTVIKYGVKF